METYVSTAPPQPPRTSIQMFGDYLKANWRISTIIVLLFLGAASTLCGLLVGNVLTPTTNVNNSTNLLTTTISTSTALVMVGSATSTELISPPSTTTTTAIACKDGLFTADDGKCYTCVHGNFDPATTTCSCDKEKNFTSKSGGDGCECDPGYLINEASVECVKCDITSKVFESFVNGVCECKQDAVLVDGLCQCDTKFILDDASSSCIPCQKSTGAFLNK